MPMLWCIIKYRRSYIVNKAIIALIIRFPSVHTGPLCLTSLWIEVWIPKLVDEMRIGMGRTLVIFDLETSNGGEWMKRSAA